MPTLTVGDLAPRFSLRDQDGNRVSSADFKGKRLLVYFYPAADTPGCTEQACSVRDARKDLGRKKVAAVGISPDAPDAQKKFDKKFSLGFPLLSDPDHEVADAYGVWGEKVMFGRKFDGIIRSSFLIDERGRIAAAWYRVPAGRTVEKALEALA
ncbi:MAG TPA: thioredoxin-dependent thiol peroxidase [Candidatus Polarisedimenticolaceae bacterium]|nr:thioredoxin-dependent thiol peroxidase [Candidatus Polarisedimenticolaceae bacterium]